MNLKMSHFKVKAKCHIYDFNLPGINLSHWKLCFKLLVSHACICVLAGSWSCMRRCLIFALSLADCIDQFDITGQNTTLSFPLLRYHTLFMMDKRSEGRRECEMDCIKTPRKIQNSMLCIFPVWQGLYIFGFSTKSLSLRNSLSIITLASFPITTVLWVDMCQAMTNSYLWCPAMSRVSWEKGGCFCCHWFNGFSGGTGRQPEMYNRILYKIVIYPSSIKMWNRIIGNTE